MNTINESDYDSAWKEVIEKYFKEFLAFFFPDAYSDIDFSKGYEFLDKELNKIFKRSKQKKRYVDKLVKVSLKDGLEQWLLIHIEVQGYEEKDFEKRLYVYNYRLFDRHNKEVVTLVILTDEDESYLPEAYQVKRWGFEHYFAFPVVKLICYRDKIDLDKASNPFEIITFAHLKTLETKNNFNERLFWKITLVKLLYQKGYSKQDILDLYYFIDWIMELPEDLSEQFNDEIINFEEDSRMRHVTTAERIGIKKGIELGMEQGIEKGIERGIKIGSATTRREDLQEMIEDLLEVKFNQHGAFLMSKVLNIDDVDMLRQLKEVVKRASHLDEIEKALERV
jgi:hypothetical protein